MEGWREVYFYTIKVSKKFEQKIRKKKISEQIWVKVNSNLKFFKRNVLTFLYLLLFITFNVDGQGKGYSLTLK